MLTRWIAGLGLCAALFGTQPGCAHQMTNGEFAAGAIVIGMVVGGMALSAATDHCKGPATCTRAPAPSEVRETRLLASDPGVP